jgi:NAD(P)-dependent dehydrogenase (short-subunit alcohol dehydrogenase family)
MASSFPVTKLVGDFAGQTVVILGGSAGMGKACAASVLARGGNVWLLARTPSRLEAAAASLAEACGISDSAERIRTHAMDGESEEDVAAFFEGIEAGSIHHLVATVSRHRSSPRAHPHLFRRLAVPRVAGM